MRFGRFAICAATVFGLLALPVPPPAAADPDQAKLSRLTKEAARLNNLYRGQIQSLEETRLQAKKASDSAGDLQGQLDDARDDVSNIAQLAYITGSLDNVQLFGLDLDPYKALGQAANMTYMADERAGRVLHIQDLIQEAGQAKKDAAAKIKGLEQEIAKMKSKRREIERLLAKFGFQQPGGSEGLTPRMIAVRAVIMQNFPMPYGVGCLRPGDPGEHGKGRACDFMMSSGGKPASGADADRGDALAAWLIKNGPRIGVMYIIWKQRYYDIRSGAGWRPMADRGGVTANHWDHVHVSVF
ncbi:coiled-coil domain-containing protein [Nonomuraea sp. NPDC050536]|uniref:coiled-coil domain-containing protein n=1 Tax=Nonomuraea sp. NPDC050536 TaxID=3364366 RepID=UPI0037CB7580